LLDPSKFTQIGILVFKKACHLATLVETENKWRNLEEVGETDGKVFAG
jgi:hypothetical protein